VRRRGTRVDKRGVVGVGKPNIKKKNSLKKGHQESGLSVPAVVETYEASRTPRIAQLVANITGSKKVC